MTTSGKGASGRKHNHNDASVGASTRQGSYSDCSKTSCATSDAERDTDLVGETSLSGGSANKVQPFHNDNDIGRSDVFAPLFPDDFSRSFYGHEELSQGASLERVAEGVVPSSTFPAEAIDISSNLSNGREKSKVDFNQGTLPSAIDTEVYRLISETHEIAILLKQCLLPRGDPEQSANLSPKRKGEATTSAKNRSKKQRAS